MVRNYFYDSNKKILGHIEGNTIYDSYGKIKGYISDDGTISDSYSYGKIIGYIDNEKLTDHNHRIIGYLSNDGAITDDTSYGKIVGYIDNPNIVGNKKIINTNTDIDASFGCGMIIFFIFMAISSVIAWPLLFSGIAHSINNNDSKGVLSFIAYSGFIALGAYLGGKRVKSSTNGFLVNCKDIAVTITIAGSILSTIYCLIFDRENMSFFMNV